MNRRRQCQQIKFGVLSAWTIISRSIPKQILKLSSSQLIAFIILMQIKQRCNKVNLTLFYNKTELIFEELHYFFGNENLLTSLIVDNIQLLALVSNFSHNVCLNKVVKTSSIISGLTLPCEKYRNYLYILHRVRWDQ